MTSRRKPFVSCLTFGLDTGYRLELDDHLAFHQQVDAITTIDADAFVGHRQCLLTFGVQLSLSQLVRQACFICGLQQTRPRRTVPSIAAPMICPVISFTFISASSAIL